MSWLRKALGLCEHKWTIFGQSTVTNSGVKVGISFALQCEKCGNVKRTELLA